MDALLKPSCLDLDPNTPTAAKQWTHLHRTFMNFIEECGGCASNKFRTLVSQVFHNVFDDIEDCRNYYVAVETLMQFM